MEAEPVPMGQSASMDSEAPKNATLQKEVEDTVPLPGVSTDVVVNDHDIIDELSHPNNVQHSIAEPDKDVSSISLAIPKKARESQDDSVPEESGLGLMDIPTADVSDTNTQELTTSNNKIYPDADGEKNSDAALDILVDDARSDDVWTEPPPPKSSHQPPIAAASSDLPATGESYGASLAVTPGWTDVSPRRRKRVAVKTVIRNLSAGRDETEVDGPMNKKQRYTSDMLEPYDSSALEKEMFEASIPTKAAKTEPRRKTSVTPPGRSVSKKNVTASVTLPKAKATSKKPEKSPARTSAKEIWSGPPTEPLEGGWPAGWIKKVVERQSGGTAGSTDRYWYSPIENKKFRSMVEIHRFFRNLKACGGDEDQAWRLTKAKQG